MQAVTQPRNWKIERDTNEGQDYYYGKREKNADKNPVCLKRACALESQK